MKPLFKKVEVKVETEKSKFNVSIDKPKVDKYENLKAQLEAKSYQVLDISNALETQIDRLIKKLESALSAKSKTAKIKDTTAPTDSDKSTDLSDSAAPVTQNDSI
jgi:hypothetical protein